MTRVEFGGGGPTLVLLPSLGTTVEHLWGEVAHRLTDRFTVVGFDLPGSGTAPPRSEFRVEDLAATVLAGVDGQFAVAGVSIGGAVAQQLALSAPQRLSAMVVLATAARIGTAELWVERAAQVRRDGTAVLRAGSIGRWFAPVNAQSAAAKLLLDDLVATDDACYAAACAALGAFDVRDRVGEIPVRLLAVAGEHDPVTTPAHLQAIADAVPGGRYELVPDAAHQIPAERPDVVTALLREFLDG